MGHPRRPPGGKGGRSNDPDEIRAFAARHQSIVYKPFYQISWKRSETGMRSLFATKVRLEQLLHNDTALRAWPGIFQRGVEMDHEIRLTMMGDDYIALKIHPLPERTGHGRLALGLDQRGSVRPGDAA